MPLVKVLTDMEFEGIRLNTAFLKEYSDEIAADIVQIRDNIYATAGEEFNLNSPAQLGVILFDKMGIPYKGAKTKTGAYSTNEKILTDLKNDHQIIQDILAYRELAKLKSTYVDALPQLVNPKTNRLHTTYNQAVAATGRLSSINPNLQNIPIRTGKRTQNQKSIYSAK